MGLRTGHVQEVRPERIPAYSSGRIVIRLLQFASSAEVPQPDASLAVASISTLTKRFKTFSNDQNRNDDSCNGINPPQPPDIVRP